MNAGRGTVSTDSISGTGTLTLVKNIASTLEGLTSGGIDGGISDDGRLVYVLDGVIGAIIALRVGSDGTLAKIQTVTDAHPPQLGAQGIVVR